MSGPEPSSSLPSVIQRAAKAQLRASCADITPATTKLLISLMQCGMLAITPTANRPGNLVIFGQLLSIVRSMPVPLGANRIRPALLSRALSISWQLRSETD